MLKNKITMAEIHQQMKQKVQNKIEVYNLILDRCYKKIRDSIKKNYTYCVFQVPEFIYSRPIYDVVHCTQYIHRKLLESSYKINFVNATTMIIQWTVPKINWEEIDPPISIALLPPPSSPISYSSNDLNIDIDTYNRSPHISQQSQYQTPSPPSLSNRYPSLENLPSFNSINSSNSSNLSNTSKSAFNVEIINPNPSPNANIQKNYQQFNQSSMQMPVKTAKNYPIKRVIDFY
jgi:hypothetical protein